MTDPVNFDDPCQAATALRTAWYQLLAGASVASVRVGSRAGVGRDVTFTPANIEKLRNEIAALDIQCAEKNGTPVVRNVVLRAPPHRGW